VQELDDYLNQAKQFPPAPQTLPQLLQQLNDPDADMSKVVELIAIDPSLTANVLQACNSAFFGAADRISEVDQAVSRLGFEQIYRLVASACGTRMMSVIRPGWGLDSAELWKHSVTTALAAQMIARDLNEDQNLAFTSGLLHDLGRIVFACALEHIYGTLTTEAEKIQGALPETEERRLGVNHAKIGAQLLARWKFPVELVATVDHHHHPGRAGLYGRTASMVYLGNNIAYYLGCGCGKQAISLVDQEEALKILSLTHERIPYYMTQTLENVAMLELLLRMQG